MSFYGLLVRQCLIYSILSDNTGGNTMLKLETAKMQNAIEKAKEVQPKVIRMADGAYTVQGHEKAYVVKLNKAKGLYLGECHCDGYEFGNICYHIAAACALHIGIKRGYSKESPAPRGGILFMNSYAGKVGTPVEILSETKSKYEIRAITETKLGGHNHWLNPGQLAWVPKTAISLHALAGVMIKAEGNGITMPGGIVI